MQALREVEREKARASLADKQRLDIEYLKNTILKLYETGTLHSHLPFPIPPTGLIEPTATLQVLRS